MGRETGFYVGLSLATCTSVFLFTRVLIPDVALTLTITIALFSIMRALDAQEIHPGIWANLFWIAIALGVLLKGLIAVLFPVLSAGIFLAATEDFHKGENWQRLRPGSGFLVFLAIAAPWHILAILRRSALFQFHDA